jgi:formate hydrogenlyase transcriptional activator
MSAQTSWASELPAVNQTASFKVEDAASAKVKLDEDESSLRGLPGIIGDSPALRRVLATVRLVAPTDSTVLINGETGTGKELIAEAIHKCSDRSNCPFVKVNCAAIPSGLLESELFGHEPGAFTSAVARTIGRFERANHGTLFLDEIGDLPLELQPKLLRVLQERQFERLGGAATIHADVRVICATNRNLLEMVNERQFRADLFYRLCVFPIELPPLRERPEDIRLLAHHFAMGYAARMCRRLTTISESFMERLVQHSWPGNIRELQNFIERSVILSTGAVLTGLSPELTPADTSKCETPSTPADTAKCETASKPTDASKCETASTPTDASRCVTASTPIDASKCVTAFTPATLKQVQRAHILQALEQAAGVVGGSKGAAARLGMRRTTLICMMQRLGINHGHQSRGKLSTT